MIFSGCVYILMGTVLYKYEWNRSLDNKIYEVPPLLDGGARQNFCNETILVQKVVYIQSNFAFF